MGGEIWVESAPCEGSCFHFTACFGFAEPTEDMASEAAAAVHSTSAADGSSLEILVAEDNAINQRVIVSMLERRGHSVALATNGREILDLLENRHFDIVLMDVQMPEMDGLETTRAVRMREKPLGATKSSSRPRRTPLRVTRNGARRPGGTPMPPSRSMRQSFWRRFEPWRLRR